MKAYFYKTDRLSIINEDILRTEAVPEASIDLIVTSPPYNVDIKYNSHNDEISYDEYLHFSEEWLGRCFDLLKDDGRLCLNIPLDKNKGGQQSVGADLTTIARQVGFQYHATIVWNEGNISRRTAWGSWMSASAPYVIAPVELIVVLYKEHWKKTSGSRVSTISKKEFMEWTNGVWTFSGESKKKIGHPAPFPIELPERCIKLFSFQGDMVLDPFMGSGTTLVAASRNEREAIGVEVDRSYCEIARERLLQGIETPSVSQLIMEFFSYHPNEELGHGPVVDWVIEQWLEEHKTPPRDPGRAIRKLHLEGKLIKVKKGVYKYEPDGCEEVTSQEEKKIYTNGIPYCSAPEHSLGELIEEYFSLFPNEEFELEEIICWVTVQWMSKGNTPPVGIGRAIRRLYQEGKIIKVREDVYKYHSNECKEICNQKKARTISQLIMEYVSSYPNEELEQGDVVDWVTEQWLKVHEHPPREPGRTIRKLHQEGKLVKVRRGIYKYNPDECVV